MDFNAWNIVWSLCFGLLATLIVVGNILTIWIFLKQRLRKRAHFLLISLAVADLLVGLLSVPLFIATNSKLREVKPALWLCKYADICTSLASIYTLAVISLERVCAISWPVRYRSLSFRVYMIAIITQWFLAATVTSAQILGDFNIIPRVHLCVSVLSLATPLLVMCIAYFVVWRKHKSRIGNHHAEREAKLAKTLFLIAGASLLAWLPFQVLFLVVRLMPALRLPYAMAYAFKFLQFSNSLVNVIIYPLRISEFKDVLLQILHSCVISFQRCKEEAPLTEPVAIINLVRIADS